MEPIFVWWIGERAEDPAMMDHVRRHLTRAFGAPTIPWSAPDRPADSLDPARRQHLSGRILRWLLSAGPPGGKVLAVTDQDLCIPILTYVFGEAQLGGPAAVVSTARLHEGVALVGPRLLVERLAKEAVHEVGHAYGLHHCDTPGCAMGRSPGVAAVDRKSHDLCGTCRRRLKEPPARRGHVE